MGKYIKLEIKKSYTKTHIYGRSITVGSYMDINLFNPNNE